MVRKAKVESVEAQEVKEVKKSKKAKKEEEEPKDIYCGIKEVPQGKRRGTAEECAECKQIRYYGLEKIDKNLVDVDKQLKEQQKLLNKLKKKHSGFLGKRHALERDLKRAPSNEKEEAQKLLDEVIVKHKALIKQMKEVIESIETHKSGKKK
jgi:hypothetical protein